MQERAGGEALLTRAEARPSCGRLSNVWADGGYDGERFRDWVREHCGWELEVVSKPPGRKGFAVLPRRWVVERSFGWLGRSRRLSKDYEETPAIEYRLLERRGVRPPRHDPTHAPTAQTATGRLNTGS